MNGSGYIYFWRKDDQAGNIRVCKGNFAGLNVAFDFDSCDKALQKQLRQININRKRECPPPADALRVKFDLVVEGGDIIATGVSAS